MKIAMHVDGAEIRGNERQAMLLARRFRDRGHEVVVSCRRGGAVERMLREVGIRTSGVRPRGDADLVSALRFAHWLRRERADAVLLTSWKRAFIAGWAARCAGVPRLALRLGGTHRLRRGPAGWIYRYALTRLYDLAIVNSRAVARHLLAVIPGLPADRVVVVPNGIEVTPSPPAPLRAELGLEPDAPLLAAAGGLEPRKGFDLLIDAVARLGEPVHLAIAGEGPERAPLAARAAALGVAERVHLLGQRGDVPALIAAGDLFVLSSRSEGMAVVMLEAIGAGTPVVATDVGGVWEALAPREGRGAAGWIVPPDDVTALASAIHEALALRRADPERLDERAREAAWRLEHWFSVDAMIDGYLEALRPPDARRVPSSTGTREQGE